ncbi:WW domain-binding protein 4 [Rhodotorula toruloides]|uniref:WW domain-binding protein 4 n=1 Tax=Rhodotorula toruloides TaxID=5286 RepID=A0A511KRR8_RHOTO|nr:WW domain-binding protein 4 [Rhodotorula toruloides]
MADYWVSRDKYFCKYCKIYIADDKPSRIHHETGLRHKGNYERYIRDIYKKGMQEKKDRREEAEEVARVEAAAAAAMGLPPPAALAAASSSKPKPSAPGPSDPYANYTTASSLGIVDEEAEREAELRAVRQQEGRIGEWERVVKPSATYVEQQGKGKARERADGLVGRPVLGEQARGVVKREEGEDVKPDPHAADGSMSSSATAVKRGDDEEEDEGSNPIGAAKKRGFLTEKTLGDDDDDDPLASLAPIKLKKRRLTVKEQQAQEEARLAQEREKEEARSRARESGAKGGWQQVDLAQEGDEGFDPFAEAVALDEEEEGRKREEDEGEERRGKEEQQEDNKPKVSTSGFKKRKMAGAAAARKK